MSENDEINDNENMKKGKKEKTKKYHNTSSGVVRIVALLLALIMVFATCGTLIFYMIAG